MKKRLSLILAVALVICGMPAKAPIAQAETTEDTGIVEMIGNIPVYNVNAVQETIPQAVETTSEYASSYDPRGTALVTSVKNQENFGLCNAFSMASTIESALIKQGLADNTIDISEMQIAYMDIWHDFTTKGKLYNYEQVYLSLEDTGIMFERFKSREHGFVLEEDMPYSLIRDESSFDTWHERATAYKYKIKRMYTAEPEDVQGIKKMVANYGGASVAYYEARAGMHHAVEIIGWDDSYVNTDGSTGAWLCKNSWGTVLDSGYLWLGYNREDIEQIHSVIMTANVDEELELKKEYTLTVGESINIMEDIKPYMIEGEEVSFYCLSDKIKIEDDGTITALTDGDTRVSVGADNTHIADLYFTINPLSVTVPPVAPVVTTAPIVPTQQPITVVKPTIVNPTTITTPEKPQQTVTNGTGTPYKVVTGETGQFYYTTDVNGNLTITKGKNVKNITIPNTVEIAGWTYFVKEIEPGAFQNLKKLKSVTIKATKLNSLSGKTFNKCKNLKTITLNKTGITKVAKNAFYKCHKKLKVKVIGTGSKSKDKTVKALKKTKVTVSYSKR